MTTRVLFAGLAVFGAALLWSATPARAVYECGGVQDTCSCGRDNFCICCSNTTYGTNHGNCVWYGWHMACCDWGVGLPFCRNAELWDNDALANGYTVLVGQPCARTVFVCENYTTQCGAGSVGHVGWVVTAYPNGSVDVREQGCYSWYGVKSRLINAQNASPAMKYIYRPGVTSCGGSCQCTPGATQSQVCGNCGTQSRTCQSDCLWGAWSTCTGQGVCSPGATQSQVCGNCGTQSRTCTSSCTWGAWSTCTGQGVCSPGATQSQVCGNCGTQSRTCASSCTWGAWSTCTGQGVCSPGATQSQVCGNCGAQSRTCTSSCTWGAWSTCTGEGVCQGGTVEQRECCDCGAQSRTCSTTTCQWDQWSPCHGPDPTGGAEPCDTGEPGVCAEGLVKCLEGCLSCQRVREPQPERCNDVDDDCNGLVDDGEPQELGDPPPALAARLLDHSVPRRLGAGETATCWALFENVGTSPWLAGQIWLGFIPENAGEPSLLLDSGSWPANDVLAVVSEDVLPGGVAQVTFRLAAAMDMPVEVTETFALFGQPQGAFACPSPFISVTVGLRQRSTLAELTQGSDASAPPSGSPGTTEPWVTGGCGCEAGHDGVPLAPLGLLALLVILGLFRRRTGALGVVPRTRSSPRTSSTLPRSGCS